MAKVRIWYDKKNIGNDILKGNQKLKDMERNAIQHALNNVEAQFMQQFGFQGKFEVKYDPTKYRSRFRLIAADARTTAVLKKNPGWLKQFANNMKLM